MAGMSEVATDKLKRVHRKLMPEGPRCFRWRMLRLSGPRALEVPEAAMADCTSSGVKGEKSLLRGWE